MRFTLSVVLFLVAYVAAYDVEPRQFRPTTTSTSTIVTTITCTKSVTSVCGVAPAERKRSLLAVEAEDSNDQFPISPSAVHGVEPTSQPIREVRAANPQIFYDPQAAPPTYMHPLQSGIYGGSYRPVPFFGQYGGYGVNAANNERQLLASLFNLFTVTKSSTVFSIFVSTVVPSCSTTGTLFQCPNN